MVETNICDKCGREFKYVSNFKRHKSRKTSCIKPKTFNCLTCERVYRHQSSLCKHKKTCKGINVPVVKITTNHLKKTIKMLKQSEIVLFDSDNEDCNKHVDNINDNINNNYDPLQCVYCDSIFTEKKALKKHVENNCEKVTETTIQLLKDINNVEIKIKRILDINNYNV